VNRIEAALAAAGCLAVAAAIAGLVTPPRWRATTVGLLTAGVGAAGVAAGCVALAGGRWQVSLPQVLPLSGVEFAVDALSGWVLLLVGAVTAVVGVYTIGYAGRGGHGSSARAPMAILPLFAAAMLAVPAAGSVATLLWTWELMAITSLLLVLVEHKHSDAVRTAGIWYAAMTQAGFVTLLIGLVWLADAAGGQSFADIRAATGGLPRGVRDGVFLLCLAGFVSKAGAVPLHPWLPRAHAEAPSHVSALMSAAMVKLGVYGLLRVGFDLLGGGTRWWWTVVGLLGATSALYGIMQAAVATDIKRLLAFSTSENVGLILLGVGMAGLLVQAGQVQVAGVALAAALLHMLNHAGFKSLLFGGAGSVLHATGKRDLDALGGLSRRMPATTFLIAGGAFAAAALPPSNGFISEWLLLQSMLHADAGGGTVLAVAAPIGVAVVALTAGVAVATFVKLVGTGLLARPRSAGAARAHESPAAMLLGMGLAAAGCIALTVAPAIAATPLTRVLSAVGLPASPIGPAAVRLRLPQLSAQIWPLALVLAIVGLTAAVALAVRVLGHRRRRARAWDCGDGPLTARMEYTATSFAEPLQRVFDDVLAPETDVDVTHARESEYMVAAVQYRQRIPDRVEARLYRPLIEWVGALGLAARRLASGSMHRYLAYMMTAVIVVLVAGVWR
jgi:hydrogenase-4 component B